MTQRNAPLQCPKCGEAMVHHADKLIDPTDAQQAARIDPRLGGVVQQTHGCPTCGNVEFRVE